jgi:hypothetical protein
MPPVGLHGVPLGPWLEAGAARTGALEHSLQRHHGKRGAQLLEREREFLVDQPFYREPMLRRIDVRRQQVIADEHPVARRDVEVVLVRRHRAGQRPLGVILHRGDFFLLHRVVRDRPGGRRLGFVLR